MRFFVFLYAMEGNLRRATQCWMIDADLKQCLIESMRSRYRAVADRKGASIEKEASCQRVLDPPHA